MMRLGKLSFQECENRLTSTAGTPNAIHARAGLPKAADLPCSMNHKRRGSSTQKAEDK